MPQSDQTQFHRVHATLSAQPWRTIRVLLYSGYGLTLLVGVIRDVSGYADAARFVDGSSGMVQAELLAALLLVGSAPYFLTWALLNTKRYLTGLSIMQSLGDATMSVEPVFFQPRGVQYHLQGIFEAVVGVVGFTSVYLGGLALLWNPILLTAFLE